MNPRTRTLRTMLVVAASVFGLASATHAGVLVQGWEHGKAATAEAVIAAVVLVGLLSTWLRPASTRSIALGVEGFALLGTMVGIFTMAIGVGPRTGFDIALHGLLIAGLRVA